jgi:TatD DNase family protein
MRFIDAHNHLQDSLFQDGEIDVFNKLEKLGIEYAVVNSTNPSDWPSVAKLADKHHWIIPNFGVHPWFLDSLPNDWIELLEGFLSRYKCGIGEVGLDRNCDSGSKELQLTIFRTHLEIAKRLSLPLTIHCFKRWGELLSQLEQVGTPECGFMVHSFNGPLEFIPKITSLGGYLSFSGGYLRKQGSENSALLRSVPRDRLLIESDAPNQPLAPEIEEYSLVDKTIGLRRNHPCNIGSIYRYIAARLRCDMLELCHDVRDNFLRLYGGVLPHNRSRGL